MVKREERIVAYIDKWLKHDTTLSLEEKLGQLSIAVAETDTIQVYDLYGNLLHSSPGPEIYKVGWLGGDCIERCYAVVQKGSYTIRTLNHLVTLNGQKVRLSMSGMTNGYLEMLRTIRDSYLISCPLLLIASNESTLAWNLRSATPASEFLQTRFRGSSTVSTR
jgi:two-component system, OmpR family, heavy metal sensor histidine kinase CusS